MVSAYFRVFEELQCPGNHHHHLRGIFAAADTVRAVFYTDAPYYQALNALDPTSFEHFKADASLKKTPHKAAWRHTSIRCPVDPGPEFCKTSGSTSTRLTQLP